MKKKFFVMALGISLAASLTAQPVYASEDVQVIEDVAEESVEEETDLAEEEIDLTEAVDLEETDLETTPEITTEIVPETASETDGTISVDEVERETTIVGSGKTENDPAICSSVVDLKAALENKDIVYIKTIGTDTYNYTLNSIDDLFFIKVEGHKILQVEGDYTVNCTTKIDYNGTFIELGENNADLTVNGTGSLCINFKTTDKKEGTFFGNIGGQLTINNGNFYTYGNGCMFSVYGNHPGVTTINDGYFISGADMFQVIISDGIKEKLFVNDGIFVSARHLITNNTAVAFQYVKNAYDCINGGKFNNVTKEEIDVIDSLNVPCYIDKTSASTSVLYFLRNALNIKSTNYSDSITILEGTKLPLSMELSDLPLNLKNGPFDLACGIGIVDKNNTGKPMTYVANLDYGKTASGEYTFDTLGNYEIAYLSFITKNVPIYSGGKSVAVNVVKPGTVNLVANCKVGDVVRPAFEKGSGLSKLDAKDITYQWQVRTAISGRLAWLNIAKSSSPTFTVPFSCENKAIRCKVVVANNSKAIYSTVSNVGSGHAFVAQPADLTIGAGDKAKFNVEINCEANSYSWQKLMPGTTEWKDIISESAKTANLTFTAKDANNNMKLRCAVKTSAGTMYSDAATLTVVRTDLAAPVLTGVSSTDTGVKVKWNAVEGAEMYKVFRKTGTTGSWKALGTTTKVAYTDKTAENGVQYTYTVRCVSSDGKIYMSSYDKTGKTITYKKMLANPELVSATNVTGGVKVKWKAVDGAVNYRVFRKLSGGSWEKIGDTTNTSYTDKTGVKGKTYIYTVRCISADGKTYLSDYDKTGISIKYSPK